MGNILMALFRRNKPESSHVRYCRSSKNGWDYDPESNKLYLRGNSYESWVDWKLSWLEDHLQRMLGLIEESGQPITIEAVMIEEHVAFGLWKEGSLRLEHMEQSMVTNRWIGVTLPLLGKEMQVRIYRTLYWENYSFLVSGHPNGDEVVRDIPDFLGLMAGEETGVPMAVSV